MNRSVLSSPMPVSAPGARDDRILPETRWISLLIIPFLLVAFAILFGLPTRTDTLFAWTIRPTMTPMLMGAGYVSGIYFFSRLFTSQKWHWFCHGFLPISVFTWFMGAATVLHWDRFHHGTFPFYAWAVLYAITPFLIPFLWYRNRPTDPGTAEPDDVVVPLAVRRLMGVVGGSELALALFLFLFPTLAIPVWPWTLTPLTARVLGGWFALGGMQSFVLARESRWSAMRIIVQTQLITVGLILVAALRAWGEFDRANPLTWLFMVGGAAWIVTLAAILVQLDARRGTTAAPARAA